MFLFISFSLWLEYSSLCWTPGPSSLPIRQVTASLCWSQTPSLCLPQALAPRLPQVHPLCLCVCFCFVDKFISSSDATYKWYYVIFVWFTLLSVTISTSIYIAANGIISFFLWLSSIPYTLLVHFNRWHFLQISFHELKLEVKKKSVGK